MILQFLRPTGPREDVYANDTIPIPVAESPGRVENNDYGTDIPRSASLSSSLLAA